LSGTQNVHFKVERENMKLTSRKRKPFIQKREELKRICYETQDTQTDPFQTVDEK